MTKTNRLANETSPYLLQHAHNPVDWYPWGDEAFEKAKAEDKPVLVSIGYSACHWCHVMERESFEDAATAAVMNEHFVSIKVDMEERPDVDRVYMDYVQLTTGSGGWPLNVFLTPDRVPFFGGTYFPPEPRHRMPSFTTILTAIADAWATKRGELLESAEEALGEMRRMAGAEAGGGGAALGEDLSDAAFRGLERAFDAVNGGFGGAPKFPPAMAMEFLMRYWKRTGEAKALEMVDLTARKMAEGGMYDQLGGGFHRYSVDAVWLVPHFEKMLYDNAQLAKVYVHVFQATGDELFRRVAVETLEYVQREMTDAGGGFYSAQDADSEGVEGKFFVWTTRGTEAVLGPDDARIFNFYYDISDDGNFEEANIPNVSFTLEATAKALGIDVAEVRESLDRGRAKLFAEREKRVRPFRDEKVLTAWNGLMLSAFAEAAAVLRRTDFLATARANADFLLAELVLYGRVLRSWKDGRAKLGGYLDDYANLADGLVDLFQVTGEMRYVTEARQLVEAMLDEFWDAANGGFFFTAHGHEELIVRKKEFFDNATPSGNSVAADVLLKLARLTGDEKYERFAVGVLRTSATQARRYPNAFGRTLATHEFYLAPAREIALIGESDELAREVWREYRPFKVVAPAKEPSSALSLLEGRGPVDGQPAAYVCQNHACRRPVTTSAELSEMLDE